MSEHLDKINQFLRYWARNKEWATLCILRNANTSLFDESRNMVTANDGIFAKDIDGTPPIMKLPC